MANRNACNLAVLLIGIKIALKRFFNSKYVCFLENDTVVQ